MVATLLLDAAVDSIAFEKIALGDVGSPDVDKPFGVRVVGPASAGVRITGLGNELVCLDATSIAAGLLARKSAVSARKLDGYGIEITHRVGLDGLGDPHGGQSRVVVGDGGGQDEKGEDHHDCEE